MRLMDFLITDAIEPNLKSNNKTDAIKELTALLKSTGTIADSESVAKVILEREELGSTGIGDGIAVPHSPGLTPPLRRSAVRVRPPLPRIVPARHDPSRREDVPLLPASRPGISHQDRRLGGRRPYPGPMPDPGLSPPRQGRACTC